MPAVSRKERIQVVEHVKYQENLEWLLMPADLEEQSAVYENTLKPEKEVAKTCEPEIRETATQQSSVLGLSEVAEVKNKENLKEISSDASGAMECADTEKAPLSLLPEDEGWDQMMQALGLILARGEATYCLLQNHLAFTYTQAVKTMDRLEKRGWVSALTAGSKRKIKITESEFKGLTA